MYNTHAQYLCSSIPFIKNRQALLVTKIHSSWARLPHEPWYSQSFCKYDYATEALMLLRPFLQLALDLFHVWQFGRPVLPPHRYAKYPAAAKRPEWAGRSS